MPLPNNRSAELIMGVAYMILYFCRQTVDKHIVVKEGEQFSSIFNDTSLIGEEVKINYTVNNTSDDANNKW